MDNIYPKRKLTPYWLCPSGHKHKTKETALACMSPPKNAPGSKKSADTWDRSKTMTIKLLEGQTYVKIARDHNLSGQRVAQVIRCFLRRLRQPSRQRRAGFEGFDRYTLPHYDKEEILKNKKIWMQLILNNPDEIM